MTIEDYPAPEEGFVITHYLTVEDIKRSIQFYANVLGGKILKDSGIGVVKLANTWIIVNVGGGPTDDKPEVYLSPQKSLIRFNNFLIFGLLIFWRNMKNGKQKALNF